MFITQQSFRKIVISIVISAVLIAEVVFGCRLLEYSAAQTVRCTLIVATICALLDWAVWIGEGRGKWINLSQKLMRRELRPREFIRRYDELRNDLVLKVEKPRIEILREVMVAYDVTGNTKKAFETADELIAVARKKERPVALMLKASLLYDNGRIEEAEALFSEAKQGKLSFLARSTADNIVKGDRAAAMGDYALAESHARDVLAASFPKLDNLSRLVLTYSLAKALAGQGKTDEARTQYEYCIKNCGETAIGDAAQKALETL